MIRQVISGEGYVIKDHISAHTDGWGDVEARTRESLEAGIEHFFEKYPFGGYQTKITRMPSQGVDGVWRAQLKRWRSCE